MKVARLLENDLSESKNFHHIGSLVLICGRAYYIETT